MVYIGIPSYDGKIHWTTASGLMETARWCGEQHVGIAMDVIPGDAFIGKARNLIVHRFLKSGFRDLVFVDADVGFDLRGIGLLCKAEPEIVMGLYRMKCPDPVRYPALLFDPVERHPSDQNLIRLQYGPAGFLRIRREVFDAMRERWPDEYYVNAGAERVYDYFPAGRVGINFTGEDLSFCNRAQECGFKIWAMQDIKLKHTGEKSWDSDWAIDVLNIEEARHGNIKMAEAA
jgi:hypothetical protein